ncbi:hypothetical protein HW509_10805 [Asaia spathodeae]|uniref:hypothetical protein n=1 Tax=Asaia spathodeae TaxID=657016 RepID=UPI002FC3DBBB
MGDFITRAEFERECEATRALIGQVMARQDKLEARQDEHAAELKQLKELIVSGFKDVRADVQGLKSLGRRFVEGLAAGAGISYALYQAIHAALGVHP